MAVVTTNSTLIHDPNVSGSEAPDPQLARGRPVYATGSVSNASDDSSGSTYVLARIPANAIMLPDTFFDVENWGFAQVVIGLADDTDALVDQTKASENTVTPFAQGDANHATPFWEVLGLSEAPEDGFVEIVASSEAGATGAGSMPFQFAYLMPS